MADINLDKIRELAMEYDQSTVKYTPAYDKNHQRLKELVDEHGIEAVSAATGLTMSTVQQHYRNNYSTAMVSDDRIKKAEYVFSKL